MGIAIAAITIGGWLAYSALKGMSLAEVFKAGTDTPLDPAGALKATQTATQSAQEQLPSVAGTGDNNLESMTNEMSRMMNLNQPYLWGGGHRGFSPNGPWDCSGAVSWILHFNGMLSGTPLTSSGFLRWGEAGRGKAFTVYTNPGHVFIKMEQGKYAGQCWGTTRSSPRGGPAWHQHTLIGFVPRHESGW